jgi:hypothetical protein
VSAVLDKATLRRLDLRWGQCPETVALRREGDGSAVVECWKPRKHRGLHVAPTPDGQPVFWGKKAKR